MEDEPRARSDAKPRSPDGVTIAPAPGGRKALLLLAAAAAIAAIVLLSLFGPERHVPTPVVAVDVARAPAEPDARPPAPSPPRVRPVRARASAPPSPPSAPPAEARREEPGPSGAEPPEPSGIELFPPRGTDPPKIGIVVPEGFELPEGYVRHYQATDDGQPLPPILMFHPDYDWIDENGEHVEVSEDGVVPPELAPPGMPIEMLELPEPPSQP